MKINCIQILHSKSSQLKITILRQTRIRTQALLAFLCQIHQLNRYVMVTHFKVVVSRCSEADAVLLVHVRRLELAEPLPDHSTVLVLLVKSNLE